MAGRAAPAAAQRVLPLAVLLLVLAAPAGRALDLGCQNGDVAQWLYLLNVTHSNLGGAGPDTTPPETLRFESALGGEGRGGDCVALEVSTARGAEYEPESAQLNGAGRGASALRSDAKPGQVSVRAGTRASLVFRFFRCGSSSPAALPRFNLTFYSPYGPTEQKVTASAYAQSSLRDSRVFAKSYSDEGTTFRSQGKCTGRADSEECSFTLHYTGTHEFPVILEAGDSPGGGELVEPLRFSGAACGPAPRGGSEASACSPAVCGTGFELLPEQLLPAACEQEACSEEECCRVAEDPVRGDEPPGGADESAAVAVAVASTQCSGREQTWRECPGLPVCEVCRPTNCEFEDWGDWSAVGGCSGLCKRSRGHTKNNECGKPCSGPSTETVARHDDPLCFPEKCSNTSQDCRWSEWSEWSACAKECSTCRLKQAQRSRRIDTPRRAGGRDCEGVWNQTKPCQASSDEDCKLSSWGEWTQCSKSCGTGWHSRMRRVVQEARYGGKACSGPKDEGMATREARPCNVEDCAERLECVLADWGPWEGCDGKGGELQRFRGREILMPSMNGAGGCNHVLNQTTGCPGAASQAARNCSLSDWSAWSACSKACGGQRYRSRQADAKEGACLLPGPARLHETEPCGTAECEGSKELEPCKVSSWTEWGECKGGCGMGVALRLRHVVSVGRTTQPCEESLQEAKACFTGHNCTKVDCEWADWEAWTDCTASCGGGTKRRSRTVAAVPKHGGAACPAEAKSEVASCAEKSCDNCVDGTWRQWSSWSNCSDTCYPAYKVRHRELKTRPNFCGVAATGLEDDYTLCKELPPCEKQQDCELSDWAEWSRCAVKCFGVRERARHVAKMASGGGRSCHNESLKEVEPCNPGPGEEVSPECGPDTPESCKVGEWDDWSECSATCDGGQRKRRRHVLSPAANGGDPCTDDLMVTASCGADACNASATCKDCEWGEWSEWGDCSCAGQRIRNRGIAKQPNSCGRPCEEGSARETEACDANCGDRLFCAWSEWSGMGDCSATCGSSTKMRQRTLTLSNSEKDGEYLFVADQSSPCNGNQIDVKPCPFTACEGQCTPTDCQFGAWSPWSEPSCAQLCTRKRAVETEGSCQGKPCKGPLLETKPCSKDCFLPVDCELEDWTAWNKTGCNQTGQQYRTRAVQARAENGGKPCDGPLMQAHPCPLKEEPKVDCRLADWADWTSCTEGCGGGITTRSRDVLAEGSGGGKLCGGGLDEINVCNTQKCDVVLPCKFGDWGEWSVCEEGGLTRYRSRVIEQWPSLGGGACAGALRESEACSADVDCEVSAWTGWDDCDKTCGGGQQVRQRFVETTPRGNGRRCPTSLEEVRGCAEESCGDTDCTVGDWSHWGACSTSCGSGARNRSRSYTERSFDSGTGCSLDLSEAAPCHGPPCGCKDCKWGDWEEWSKCSASCDGGQRARQRNIEQAPEPGCKPCSAELKEEMEPCGTQSCEEKTCMDGEWAEWGEWEACSATCEGGWTWRGRFVSKEANDCGRPAVGPSQESKPCNDDVQCSPDVDCEFGDWGKWSGCSADCAGVRRRERVIARHGVGGGAACEGSLEQSEPCQKDAGLLNWKDNERYLKLETVTNNNLGYAGPGEDSGGKEDDRLSRPPNIRYERALDVGGAAADLVIFPKSPYSPCDVGLNGAASPWLGSISVKSGASVVLEFALVDTKTGAPVVVEDLALKFFDMDQGSEGKSSEVVSAKGFKHFRVIHDTAIVSATDEESGVTMFHAGALAEGAQAGDPRNTTEPQEQKSLTLVYSRMSKVDLSLEVSPGPLCQSFVFAARACLTGCGLADACEDEPAVDCKYSDWSSWADCAATCGSGQRSRERRVVQQASGSGARCTGALSETGRCNNSACPGECSPVDCTWRDWGEWGECDRCGGQTTRSRRVLEHASCGGASCDAGAAEETKKCTRTCNTRSWCAWDEWGLWGPCSATCGKGLQARERAMKSVSGPADSGGDEAETSANSAAQHAAGLEGKFAQLRDRAGQVESERLKMLALSFAAGPLSVAALFFAVRACARRRAAGLESPYAPIFTADMSPASDARGTARLVEWAPRPSIGGGA